MICTCIGNCSVEKCISSLKGLKAAEVRLDLLSGAVGKEEVRRIFSSRKNLIATCRSGKFSQSECASLLLEAISAGAAYIDIEVSTPHSTTQVRKPLSSERGGAPGRGFPFCNTSPGLQAWVVDALRRKLVAAAKKAGCKVIISFHDFEKTPARAKLEALVAKCFHAGADIAKIACKANSPEDCARLLSLLDGKGKLAVVAMGKKGRLVRVVAPLLGSAIAYASPAGKRGTADGQMPAAELEKAQRMILHGIN